MKDRETERNGLILTLQGLRGILFFSIFFFHSGNFLEGYAVYDKFLIGGGTFAVSAFFILSGFVNGLSNKCINTLCEYIQFLKKKISKFYLLHISFLILSLPLHYYFLIYTIKGKIALLMDALLLQSWFSDVEVWLSFNVVTWFLSTLMFCYVVTPVMQWGENRLKKYNSNKQYRIFSFLILIIIIGSIILCFFVKNNVRYWLYAFPPVRLLDFSGGYVLAKLFKIGGQGRNKIYKLNYKSASALEVVLFIACMSFMFLYPFVDEGFRRQAFPMPLNLCLVYSLAKGKGCVSRFLSTKQIVLIGNHSYYYYISHQVISGWIYKIYERTSWIDDNIFVIDFVMVIICLLITLISRRIYEYIMIRVLKGLNIFVA